jgi:PTS hybrid protein
VSGLVLVSHSKRLADGLGELVSDLAGPELAIGTVGGTEPLGVSAEMVERLLEEMLDGGYAPLVVIGDLGSSLLATSAIIELREWREQVRLADCPMVEGAVACAMSLAIGDDVETALAQAHAAWGQHKDVG